MIIKGFYYVVVMILGNGMKERANGITRHAQQYLFLRIVSFDCYSCVTFTVWPIGRRIAFGNLNDN